MDWSKKLFFACQPWIWNFGRSCLWQTMEWCVLRLGNPKGSDLNTSLRWGACTLLCAHHTRAWCPFMKPFFFFWMLYSTPIDPSWIGSFFCSLFWVYFQSHWRGRPRILPSMLGLAFTHQLIPKQVASLPWEQLTLVTAEHQLGAFKNPVLCTQIELSYVMSLLSQVIDEVGQTLPWY